jgi:hypothetical protein
MMLRACFAAPAVTAMVMAGAGTANASAVTPGVPGAASNSRYVSDWPHGSHGPGRYFCSRWQLERWNLNGTNSITAVYQNSDFGYTVTFEQDGSCLTGTLTDPYIPNPFPKSGPVSGTVRGNTVTFSFTYPQSIQGTRTYTGTISRSGAVSGTWTENGSLLPDNGTWSLGTKAARACPWRSWWRTLGHVCFVRG